jgi:hypothetical protein
VYRKFVEQNLKHAFDAIFFVHTPTAREAAPKIRQMRWSAWKDAAAWHKSGGTSLQQEMTQKLKIASFLQCVA